MAPITHWLGAQLFVVEARLSKICHLVVASSFLSNL